MNRKKMIRNIFIILILSISLITCSKEGNNNQVYAGFSISQGPFIAPCNIIFYNQSQDAQTYLWEFGDASTSTETNPTHTFSSPGTYTVVLKASNNSTSKTYTRNLTILASVPHITSPPDSLGLNPFYTKYVDAQGIPIISSNKVPDEALIKVMEIVNWMLQDIPAVRDKMISFHGRVGIMSEDEMTTDIPEHAFLANDPQTNWNTRARGLGGTVDVPITTCAEENVLCYSLDPYHPEDILIHEFAHAIHLMGIQYIYPTFNAQLTTTYNNALSSGKWANTYAANNVEEYWAEGVQDWFDCNNQSIPPNGVHNHVNTRKELQEYDIGLYNLLEGFFTSSQNPISCHYSN